MAKFTRKKPKKPTKKSKSPKQYADAMEGYVKRLKDYNSAKAAHEKKQASRPKNVHKSRAEKLEAMAQKLR